MSCVEFEEGLAIIGLILKSNPKVNILTREDEADEVHKELFTAWQKWREHEKNLQEL